MRAYQASAVLWRHTWVEYETLGQVLGSPREWGLQGLENRGSVWSPGGRHWLWVVCKVISLKNTCCHLLVWNTLPCNYLGPEEHLRCAIPDLFSEWMFLVNCSGSVGLVCYRKRFFLRVLDWTGRGIESLYSEHLKRGFSYSRFFFHGLLMCLDLKRHFILHASELFPKWWITRIVFPNFILLIHTNLEGGLLSLTNIMTRQVEPIQAERGRRQGTPWASRQVQTGNHHSHIRIYG